MRKVVFQFGLVIFVAAFFLSACTKGSISDITAGVQQGDTTVGIFAQYVHQGSSQVRRDLLFKYSYVLTTDIKVGVDFYIHDLGKKHLQFTIPANNANPVAEINGKYLNNWFYPGGSMDSITDEYVPTIINPEWEVDSLKISSVHTDDTHYGFKVMQPDEQWSVYLEVKNPITSYSFKYNGEDVSFADYDFKGGSVSFNNQFQNYIFRINDFNLQMFSGVSSYPLQEGMTLDIPIMLFYDVRQWGAEPDAGDGSNGTYSTIKLKVDKVSNSHLDASFEGKIFSTRQPDTLFITDGVIKNLLIHTE